MEVKGFKKVVYGPKNFNYSTFINIALVYYLIWAQEPKDNILFSKA